MKKKVINIKRQDHCIKCNTDRTVELYDIFNRPTNYQYFLDNIDKVNPDAFNKRELSYMKCRKCGAEYQITWENKIPEPMINKNTMYIFVNKIFKYK